MNITGQLFEHINRDRVELRRHELIAGSVLAARLFFLTDCTLLHKALRLRSSDRQIEGEVRKPRLLLVAGLGLTLVAGTASPAIAHVHSIRVDATRTIAARPGDGIVAYRQTRGRLIGEVDPRAHANRLIQDILLAPRNGHGRVSYVSTFTILEPADRSRSNGILLMMLPNRGNQITPFGNIDFLLRRGYSILWVGWQGDLAERPSADRSAAEFELESIAVPRITRPGRKPITGPYLVRAPTNSSTSLSGTLLRLDQGNAGPLAYFPASYDTRRSTLSIGAPEAVDGTSTGPRRVLGPKDWQWWNCSAGAPAETASSPADLCVKLLRGSLGPRDSATFVFTARDPLVLGLGLAAIRDAASFFRYSSSDNDGNPNPLAGAVHHVIGVGVSQVGNLVKTVIALGFTTDEQGRPIWDGANAHIAGRKTPINYRFATPGSSPTLYMPGNEGVLWWGASEDRFHDSKIVSLLDRCTAAQTCPKIFETFGGAEFWNQRMSSGLVTADLRRDIELPGNVRRYFFPGTMHGGGRGGFALETEASGSCVLPSNPNPETAQMRALFIALSDWVTQGVAPPPSRYPRVETGELVRDTRGELAIPAWGRDIVPFGIANPILVYDYGSRFNHQNMSGIIDAMPPAIRHVVPALVPAVDRDSNERGGLPSVEMQVPLGSYLSWNIYRDGPYQGRICSAFGGFIPFARTRAEREASGDARLSIAERYGSRESFVEAVRNAARQAVETRVLLPEDGSRIVEQAAEAARNGDLSFLPGR